MQTGLDDEAAPAGGAALPTTYRVAPGKLFHGLLVAGLLTLVGLWMLFFADQSVAESEVAGLVILALAAVVVVIALRRARDRRPLLVLDRDGVWYRDWGLAPVPWEAIAQVAIGGSRLQSFACLEVEDPDALLAGLSQEERRKVTGNRLVRLPRLMIPNGALDAPLQDIVAAIRSGRERHP